MKRTEISNRGLLVIALLVTFLWCVIFAERSIVRKAREEHNQFLRSLPVHQQETPPEPPPEPSQRAMPAPRPNGKVAYG